MNNFPKPEWLCFDLDGTLVDSAPDLTLSLNHMLSELQLKNASEEAVRTWIGNGAHQLILRALAHGQLIEPTEPQIEQARALFFAAYAKNVANRSTCYPNCLSVLHQLHTASVQLACVTNKPRQFVLPLLQKLDLLSLFDVIVCGDDLTAKKPDPAPLIQAVQNLDSTVESGYMVGDSVTDIMAAHAAGMGAIYATYGYNRGVCVDQYRPVRINSLVELLQLFNFKSALDVSFS